MILRRLGRVRDIWAGGREFLCTQRLSADEHFEEEGEFSGLLEQNKSLGAGHRVLVIQPRVKWGPGSDPGLSSHQLQIEEAEALVRTLPKWSVADSRLVNVHHSGKGRTVFGTGKLVELSCVLRSGAFTAAFVNVGQLSGAQHAAIAAAWGLPVFDRYNIVLQIFKTYARTAEAKLQVALAEIPYVRARLRTMHGSGYEEVDTTHSERLEALGASGESHWQGRRFLLNRREAAIRARLAKLRRERARTAEARRGAAGRLPEVAVLGYTNAGKTSLIRLLSQDERCRAEDRLFATLDVSRHGARLPCGLGLVYGDTVGFISKLPTLLLNSFHATIDDIKAADVLVHVRDVSHPDTRAQKAQVLHTLREIGVAQPLLDGLVEVANKSDRLHPGTDLASLDLDPEAVRLSCATKEGLGELLSLLELRVLDATGSFERVFRVASGSREWAWLAERGLVLELIPEPSSSFVFLRTLLNAATAAQFGAAFPAFRHRKRPG